MSRQICLIGAGRIGRIHAANLARMRGVALRYVVDVDRASAAELAGATGAQPANLDQALADPKIDGIVVASSTDTHLSLIRNAAAAGKPVFCEKPLDLDAGNARAAIAAAADAGIPLYVGFNRRYDPAFRRIRDDIVAGAIGAVEVVSITSRDPAPPPIDYVRRSGGLFRDMTIHDFDMARWLLPGEPARVFATGSCLADAAIGEADDIDTATVILETADGVLCQITNSRRCRYGYDQRLEVFGADGMLRAGNETATRVERANGDGFLAEPALPFFLERYATAYRLQMQDFAAALNGEGHSLANGEDGLAALLLADAADHSRRGNRPVSLVE